jgi:hypothetical protein
VPSSPGHIGNVNCPHADPLIRCWRRYPASDVPFSLDSKVNALAGSLALTSRDRIRGQEHGAGRA